ncbi:MULTISPECIES: ATP-binding protein [Streptomyces]|uniref:ATP-binding protein n=1 Tax=Streptomyces TaxID=1883 RepID=UPI00200BEAE4|nr:ATP-binding protein [Streptomyces sp. LRE541]UPZ27425.1 ATP-binding protein [Streptomyces sp. LRE541]
MNRDVLIWCLGAVAVIATAAVVALVARNRALGARKRQFETESAQRLAEAESRLSAALSDLQKFRAEQDDALRDAERTAEESTKAVLKGAVRFLQSLAAEQTTLLDGIQRKHGGHAVLSDLLDVNHATAQMARKAQGIAVMCGAPLSRRSQPASVFDVVRNAQGQIRNFNRVQIMQQSGIALKASAVSPVALAVAELLDNAASFSQHDAPIEVTFQRVQKNLCIVIDDAGVGMNDEDRQKATVLLSGNAAPRLSQLGAQPKFGLPVVGLIARQYGFKVDVTGVSRYGGVRAVVLLPEELWTMEETPQAPAQEAPVRRIRHIPTREDEPESRTVHGLPKRGERQSPTASVTDTGSSTGGNTRPFKKARGVGGLAAIQRGTMSGRAAEAPSSEGTEDA